jgi:hypothetical protein
MPTDIEVGAGYCGDALFTRFPGQYRNPEMEGQERANFANFPGNHGPVYTDPDAPRKTMVMKEIPGIGQVVVPVEHTMAQVVVPVEHTMAGVGAVYPSDHTMVGMGDDPNTNQGQLHWHNTLVDALNKTAHITNVPQQLSIAFNAVVQKAVQTALDKAKKGQFASVAAAVKYIHDAIVAAALHFKPELRMIADRVADTASKSATAALKMLWKAPSGPGRKRLGMSDWPGSMMGSIGAWPTDIWNALTGKPQSWYTQVSNAQDLINLTLAGVTAIGKDAWNSFGSGTQGPTQDGSDLTSGIDDYDTVVNTLQSDLTAIIVTQSYVPSDAAIAQAQSDQANYANQLSLVQQAAPQLAPQVQAGQAQEQAMTPPPMVSPTAVAQQTFTDTIAQRAKQLMDTGTSIMTYVAVGAGIVGGIYILSNLKTFGLA